jgi:hypothetical protein
MSKMLKRDWVDRHVRLKRQIENKGGTIFKEGEVMRVTRNFGGLHLEAVHGCDECRRKYRLQVKGISERDVVLLPENFKPKENEWPYER